MGQPAFPVPDPDPERPLPAGRSHSIWDLSVRGEHWGLDDRDDIMNVVNIGSLHLAPGAIVTVRGNLLILIVQRLICDSGASGAAGQLAILPTPFSVDSGTGPLHGASGLTGRDGADGTDGAAAPTAATWLGPRLTGPVVPGACDGRDGGDAIAGGDGTKGRTGGASKLAEITIGELTGTLTVVATAGRGGDGGGGGDGGHGGHGGRGAPGQRTLQGLLPPGRGGDGGHGGAGGPGAAAATAASRPTSSCRCPLRRPGGCGCSAIPRPAVAAVAAVAADTAEPAVPPAGTGERTGPGAATGARGRRPPCS